MTLGKMIRQEIVAQGKTQVEVARLMGLPVQNLNGMLLGHRALTIRHLATLEGILGLGYDYGRLAVIEGE